MGQLGQSVAGLASVFPPARDSSGGQPPPPYPKWLSVILHQPGETEPPLAACRDNDLRLIQNP